MGVEPLLYVRHDVIDLSEAHLLTTQRPRNNYRELLELIISLSGIPQRGICFACPGALHRVRRMAKMIYTENSSDCQREDRPQPIRSLRTQHIRRCMVRGSPCITRPF